MTSPNSTPPQDATIRYRIHCSMRCPATVILACFLFGIGGTAMYFLSRHLRTSPGAELLIALEGMICSVSFVLAAVCGYFWVQNTKTVFTVTTDGIYVDDNFYPWHTIVATRLVAGRCPRQYLIRFETASGISHLFPALSDSSPAMWDGTEVRREARELLNFIDAHRQPRTSGPLGLSPDE